MSYIEIEIGGKKRGLKFNQLALETYTKNLKGEALKTSHVYATIYAGLIGNCYVKQTEPDFTFEDVCDWVEKADKESLSKACILFGETDCYKELMEAFKESIRALSAPKEEKKDKKKVKQI